MFFTHTHMAQGASGCGTSARNLLPTLSSNLVHASPFLAGRSGTRFIHWSYNDWPSFPRRGGGGEGGGGRACPFFRGCLLGFYFRHELEY